jgi:hypothetical protein
MKKKDDQTYAEFQAAVEFTADHINSLGPTPIVSFDQKAMVLMDGVRHLPAYTVTLETLEGGMVDLPTVQQEAWNTITKHLSTCAARDEGSKDKKTSAVFGMSAFKPTLSTVVEECRNFARGRCNRGSKCKYGHSSSNNGAGRPKPGSKHYNQMHGFSHGSNVVRCDFCGKHGHEAKKCRLKSKEQKGLASQVANLTRDVQDLVNQQSQQSRQQFSFRAVERVPWWEASRVFQVVCFLTLLLGTYCGLELGSSTLVAVFSIMATVEVVHVLLKAFIRYLDTRSVHHQPGVSLPGDRFGSLTPWELKRIRKLRRVSHWYHS